MVTQLSIPENALVVKETCSFIGLCFTTRTTLQNLSQYAPGIAENLHNEVARLNLNVTGLIQWIYTGVNGDLTQEFQLEIVMPIDQTGAPSEKFTYKEFSSLRCATYTFIGPWSDFPTLYDALFNQFYRYGYRNDGRVREIYNTINVEDPIRCMTEIQIGIL